VAVTSRTEDWAAPTVPGPCQAGNPALLPVLPTITGSGWAGILAGVASGSDFVSGDGGPPPSGQPVETLGIADVVMTILEARKTMPWATAAAVSRESRGDVIHVRVSLLESSGRPEDQPGRGDVVAAFTARQLGADLVAAFGSKDMIILK
jgi:hypothetical protein